MSVRVSIDGALRESQLAQDRGLHYGDGLFETMAVRAGSVRYWDKHLARLTRGCHALGIPAPVADTLRDEFQALDLAPQCLVKLILTRGDGRRGYAPDPAATARRIWAVFDWPDVDAQLYADGAWVAWLETTLSSQPALAGLKHLNRLDQVLAARELSEIGAHEGLVCDERGQVVEGVSANVFMVRNGSLATPDLSRCGVAGVMREVVMELAGIIGIEADVAPLRRADFAFADEVFLTNSVRGIVPVQRLGNVAYPRREVTEKLCQALAEANVVAD